MYDIFSFCKMQQHCSQWEACLQCSVYLQHSKHTITFPSMRQVSATRAEW